MNKLNKIIHIIAVLLMLFLIGYLTYKIATMNVKGWICLVIIL